MCTDKNVLVGTDITSLRISAHRFCDGYQGTVPYKSDAVKDIPCRQAKDADGKFCLDNRCQRQPSANHVCV